MNTFKRPPISKKYVSQASLNFKVWLEKLIGFDGLLLLLVITICSNRKSVWFLSVLSEIAVLAVYHILNGRERNYSFRYKKNLCAFLMMGKMIPLGVEIPYGVRYVLDTAQEMGEEMFLFYILFMMVLLCLLFMSSSLMLDILISFVLYLVKNAIRWELKAKFPVSKTQLKKCGVEDQKDCVLFYCWLMHRFGKERYPVITPEDLSNEVMAEMETQYLALPRWKRTEWDTEHNYRDILNGKRCPETKEERNEYAFWVGSQSNIGFYDQLYKTNLLYRGGKDEDD